jgi:hypothetical protein
LRFITQSFERKSLRVKIKVLLTLTIFGFIQLTTLYAQHGGTGVYDFLNTPVSARVAALGGSMVPVDDGDITLSLTNPALIKPSIHNQLALAYVNYFADINYGSVQYARSFESLGNFAASLQYFNYGTFDYADEGGNRDGTFNAADMAFTLGWGRELDSSFSIGANLKFVNASYESYNSFGLAVDVAGTYQTKSGWLVALTARNIGSELSSFLPGDPSTIPFSMQLGLSKRLDHVPFRFILVYDHLQKWDLTYDDPLDLAGNIDPITGEKRERDKLSTFGDQLMRHIIMGGEFYIGNNLILRGSYNYKRRQEMKIPDKLGMVGFSWGLGIRLNRFHLSYSRSAYHVVGSPNYFTITTNLDSFGRNF